MRRTGEIPVHCFRSLKIQNLHSYLEWLQTLLSSALGGGEMASFDPFLNCASFVL